MSENPAHPDAHPTAPGGMSRAALVAELVDEYGWEAESDWDGTSWPQLIQWVIDERGTEPDHDVDDECEAEDDPEVEALEAEEDGHGYWEKGDYTYSDPVNRSAKRMFDTVPAEEPDDDGGLDIDALLDEIDAPVLAPSTDLPSLADMDEMNEVPTEFHTEGPIPFDDDGMLDPEALFEEMFAARAEELSTQPPPLFLGIPGVKDYIFDGHAGAGPSGAERWMNCTMSLSASRKFLETLSPNQQREFARGSTAARQGTTAHAAGEARANHMLGRLDDDELDFTLLELEVNPEHETEAYDDEMADYISEYVDLIKSYAQERGADAIELECRVEAAIPLTDMHEDEVYVIRGSADATVLPVGKHKSLVVVDLKYGEGMDVDVDENPQIRLYALGVLGQYLEPDGTIPSDFKRIEYIIAQPRLGGIKRWEESVDDLLTWRDEVLAPELTRALYGAPDGATYSPSDLACQWCPARGGCPALAEAVIESGSELFTAMSEAEHELGPGQFPETSSLPSARLAELLKMSEDVDKLRKSLKEEAQRRLHRGEHVPGYHLVNYSPPRHWDADKMGEDPMSTLAGVLPITTAQKLFTEPVLMSPPAVEKVLGKELFPKVLDLVVKPEPVPVIGRENDRRKAWEGKPPEAMFADETGDADE